MCYSVLCCDVLYYVVFVLSCDGVLRCVLFAVRAVLCYVVLIAMPCVGYCVSLCCLCCVVL